MILFNFLELHEVVLLYQILMESFEMLNKIRASVQIEFFDKHESPKVYNHVTEILNLKKKTYLDKQKGILEKHLQNYNRFRFFAN